MTLRDVRTARRNAAVLGGTCLTVGVLFMFPSSVNSTHRSLKVAAAPAGVVGTGSAVGTTPPGQKASTPPLAEMVINGSAVDTEYGPVQVQLTVRSGHIVSARAIDYPQNGGRDREINSYAIPILQQETVTAQNRQIDTVSGATYTSDGYVQSLQSALDAAHLH